VGKMKITYYISKIIKKIQLPAIKDSKIDKTSKVCSGSHVVETYMDKYSYIGNYCTVVNSEIGKFCSIADNCIIGGASHPISWVSTSPVFHQGKNVLKKNFSQIGFVPTTKTYIGNDVWIGNNCLIKSGIKINHGAVIGMGSVVTKDVGLYEIWAGNPAKLIKKRFTDKTIDDLLAIKWWNLRDEDLGKISNNFSAVQEFIEINR
jgi:acetyltransferase-like isoleucine patch superfamily enzyme